MKKKMTLTFSNKLFDTLNFTSTIYGKKHNEILEEAFWSWYESQDEDVKNTVTDLNDIKIKVRKRDAM